MPTLVTTEALGQKLLAPRDADFQTGQGVRFWDDADTMFGLDKEFLTQIERRARGGPLPVALTVPAFP